MISVVMSVYNGEQYLYEAIQSILLQTFKDFEFIIINDGSTDNTANIIGFIEDKRIKIINNENNLGLIQSLNIGLACANGEFVARMDADDISDPMRFEKELSFFEKNKEVALCGTRMELINAGKKKSYFPLSHNEIKMEMLTHNPIVHSSVMWRRKIFEQFGFLYDSNFPGAEDYEFWSRVIFKTQIANLPETLLYYRCHDKQVTQSKQKLVERTTQKIKISLLRSLELFPDERETTIHLLLFNNQFKDQRNASAVKDADNWLYKIYSANRKYQQFDEMLLIKTWKSKLFVSSIYQYDLEKWRILRESWCFKLANVTMYEKFKLFIKCLIKRKVGA